MPRYLGSQADRCFAAIQDEQNPNQNYFCGAFVKTPGPAAYNKSQSSDLTSKGPKSIVFGGSSRVLSESTDMWVPNPKPQSPSSTTYNLGTSSTEDFLISKLRSANWEFKQLMEKKSAEDVSCDVSKYDSMEEVIKSKIQELSAMLNKVKAEKSPHNSKLVLSSPKKPGFSSTSKREFQVDQPLTDSPNFYRGAQEWMFGIESRPRTIEMDSFRYSEHYKRSVIDEEQSSSDVLTGYSMSASKCRNTDFFGPQANALIKGRLGAAYAASAALFNATGGGGGAVLSKTGAFAYTNSSSFSSTAGGGGGGGGGGTMFSGNTNARAVTPFVPVTSSGNFKSSSNNTSANLNSNVNTDTSPVNSRRMQPPNNSNNNNNNNNNNNSSSNNSVGGNSFRERSNRAGSPHSQRNPR